jgi:hypothetical protein
MPDTDIDKTTKASTIPKKPPKRPTRDYSAIPQKPITLKHRKKKPVPSKQKAAAKEVQQEDIPSPRKNRANPWHLEGISEEAKAAIVAGAEREGLTIAQYLELMALRQDREAVLAQTQSADPEILSRISAIEQRLERVEKQRGFWGSFWDKVMNDAD